jgi:lysophospholipase L1-like esterase
MIRAGKLLGGASLFAVAATAAATGTAAAQEGPASAGYSYYVAFGDSYSSGVGATTTNAGDPCVRSQSAWTVRVEADIGNPPFVHAACSGATTQDILAQGPKFAEQGGSQIAFLPPADQLNGALITIQVGGNDIRHESECLMGIKQEGGTHGPIPPACSDVEYAYNNATETVAALAADLDYLYQNLHAMAPNATIVAVGYPHLVSTTNAGCEQTSVGAVLNLDLRQKFNAIVDAGNAQIKATAGNLGIAAITDEIAAAFEGHEACSTDEWIVSPEQLQSLAPSELERIGHPNDVGHQALAEVVLTYLPASGRVAAP